MTRPGPLQSFFWEAYLPIENTLNGKRPRLVHGPRAGPKATAETPLLARHPFPASVGNTVFSAFPPRHPGRPALPRPEGPRQSLRSGSRSDSFRGSVQGGCTEMHYSPRIWQRRGPELPLLFPLPGVPLKGAVTVTSSQWPTCYTTIGYLFTLLLTMISHSPSTP
jgi:hypothetical protein